MLPYLKNVKSGIKPQVKAGIRPQKPRFGGAQSGMRPMPPQPGGGSRIGPGAPPQQPPVATLNDSRFMADQNALTRNLNDANLGFQNQEFGVKEQFGFDPQFASNPYTRANLLQRAANQRFNSTTNTMAGRGQLYSGATSRARDADTFTSGAETDAARREYAQALSGIEASRLSARREHDSGLDRAYLDQIERAQSADLDPSLFPEETGSEGGGGNKKGGKKQPKPPYSAGIRKQPGLRPVKVDPKFNKPTVAQRKKK